MYFQFLFHIYAKVPNPKTYNKHNTYKTSLLYFNVKNKNIIKKSI